MKQANRIVGRTAAALVAALALSCAPPEYRNPDPAPEFIVFGYMQSNVVAPHIRWDALTHVGTPFVEFDATGRLTNRNAFVNRPAELRAGGAAQAAGVRVVPVIANRNFDLEILNATMTSAEARRRLVSEIAALVLEDDYCAGVSFDFEPFSWNEEVRDGMSLFFREMRAALGTEHEISFYVAVTPRERQFDIPAIEPHVDYLLYSMYDFAVGQSRAQAVSNFEASLPRMRWYMERGMPPHRIVAVMSTYSRSFPGAERYGARGSENSRTGRGYITSRYETAIHPRYENHYAEGTESGWYYTGTEIVVWEDPRAIRIQAENAKSFQDPGRAFRGARLGGVGFWSLRWLSGLESADLRRGGATDTPKVRTNPEPYWIVAEALAEEGRQEFVFESFAGLGPRWADPNESHDTRGVDRARTARRLVPSPEGFDRPRGTVNALRVDFAFTEREGGQVVMAHEILAPAATPRHADFFTAPARVGDGGTFHAHVYAPRPHSEITVRLLVIDGEGQLEGSRALTLDSLGWSRLSWTLEEDGAAWPFATVELSSEGRGAFRAGDGVLDGIDGEERPFGFYGFLIEANGPAEGWVAFDALSYELPPARGGWHFVERWRTTR